MKDKLLSTTKESLYSVLPITAVVFGLSVLISPMPAGTLILFLFGAALVAVGMGLFTMGADMALIPVGEDMGVAMTKTKKIVLVALISFSVGFVVTIAEPDLQVLAQLAPGIPNLLMILTVAAGTGVFLIVAIFHILFQISLSKILAVSYFLVIVLSIFSPNKFVPVAFDAGGASTGPITVPVILAMGFGLASIRADKGSMEDSFGLAALCSIGPILSVLILGIWFRPQLTEYVPPVIPDIVTTRDAALAIVRGVPEYFREVVAALWPVLAMLVVFQLLTRRYHKFQLLRLLVGYVYAFIGLMLFLTGVNVGFIPVGHLMGADLVGSPFKWLLIPLGALIGYFIVAAEPAVHVLKKQVEEVSSGAIPGKLVHLYLSIGTSAALVISMARVLTGFSIYWVVIPGYIIAVVLAFFTPKIFVGIAFDSGGVVSGPMSSSFLLPFAIGACANPERIMTDAFGLMAMVALTPLIALQLMGIIYQNKMRKAQAVQDAEALDDGIIEFEEALHE